MTKDKIQLLIWELENTDTLEDLKVTVRAILEDMLKRSK